MTEGWYEDVASRCGADTVKVETVLRKRGIRASAELRRGRNLHITSVAFSGEKKGKKATGRFGFTWTGLGDGVWATASEGTNFVGKSTVLEVLLWSLRGEVKNL